MTKSLGIAGFTRRREGSFPGNSGFNSLRLTREWLTGEKDQIPIFFCRAETGPSVVER
jgi:hypothetical protein